MMDKRKAIETEMDAIIARLNRPGEPGLQGNLVDAEGFLRADLDIPVVRSDRQRLSALRNDHKEITDAIEKNLITLHSGGFTTGSSQLDKRTGLVAHPMLCVSMMSSLIVQLQKFINLDITDDVSCKLWQQRARDPVYAILHCVLCRLSAMAGSCIVPAVMFVAYCTHMRRIDDAKYKLQGAANGKYYPASRPSDPHPCPTRP